MPDTDVPLPATAEQKRFSTIAMNQVFSSMTPVTDAGMYITIAGIDPAHSVRFQTAGGYALSGVLGRSLYKYAELNNSLDTMSYSTSVAIKCLVRPIISALIATMGSMVIPGAYGGAPFEVFKTGSLIYLLSDGLSIKWDKYSKDEQ